MGIHTNIYFSHTNKSLYFRNCYPNDISAIKGENFEKDLQELYLKRNDKPAEFQDGNAFIDNDFPHDFYFEFDGKNLFEIIETESPYEFIRIELDGNYNNEIASRLEAFFNPSISFDMNPPKRKIALKLKLSEIYFIRD